MIYSHYHYVILSLLLYYIIIIIWIKIFIKNEKDFWQATKKEKKNQDNHRIDI